jgi:transcriptional regulator with XRE-family HTH domain
MANASYIDQALRSEIGLKLRALLKQRHLTQEQAAKLVNVHRTAFNRYLMGRATPRGEMLAKLCDEFGLTVRIGGKDLCAKDFPRSKGGRGSKEGDHESRQYDLEFGRPLVFQAGDGSVSVEITKRPASQELQMTVRFAKATNIPA